MERLENMTSTMALPPPAWRTQRVAAPATRKTDRNAVPATTRPENPPRPSASPDGLSRLWLGALEGESRHAEPFERMALALLVVAAGTALVGAVAANTQLVTGWSGFVQWVTSALF